MALAPPADPASSMLRNIIPRRDRTTCAKRTTSANTLVAPGGTQQSSVRVGNDTTLAGASVTAGRFQLRLSVPQAAQSAAYSFELKLR